MGRVRQPAPIPRGLSSWLLLAGGRQQAACAYSSYFACSEITPALKLRPSAGSLLLSETLDLVRAGCRQA